MKKKRSGVPAYHTRSGVVSSECLVLLQKDRKIWVIHSRDDEREREKEEWMG